MKIKTSFIGSPYNHSEDMFWLSSEYKRNWCAWGNSIDVVSRYFLSLKITYEN